MKNIQPLVNRYERGKNPHPIIMEADIRYLIGEVWRLQEFERAYRKIEESYYQAFERDDGIDEFLAAMTAIVEYINV
jgi:DNA-binding transcriptional regulator PaaX